MQVDPVIELQPLGGQWEMCGTGRLRGITPDPDSLVMEADLGGPSSCGFVLRRDPRYSHPDLTAYTPCKISLGGPLLWRGRVRQTPSRDGAENQIAVAGQGLQYHLDDDTLRKAYVHTRLSDFKDRRSHLDTVLGANNSCASGVVSNEGGVQISFPDQTVVQNGSRVGVMLDLGPGNAAARWVLSITTSNNNNGTPQVQFSLHAAPTPSGDLGTLAYGPFALTTIGAGPATIAVTPAAGSRYLFAILQWNAAGTSTNDAWVKILTSKVFASTAYESGNESVFKASTGVQDIRDQTTSAAHISRANTRIEATTFDIDDFVIGDDRTGRQGMEALNAFHDNQLGVNVNRELVFRAKPARPILEVGSWAGAEFSDASMNSGDEIYNRVIVEGTGPDGEPLRVERTAGQQAGVLTEAITSPAADNPSFATNTTSWTAGSGTAITRDTGVFDTTPASGRWDRGAGGLFTGDTLSETFTGTFLGGATYLLKFMLRITALETTGQNVITIVTFGTSTDFVRRDLVRSVDLVSGEFRPITLSWTPTIGASGVTLLLRHIAYSPSTAFYYIDSLQLFKASPTLVDRRAFRRTKVLPINAALTTAGANKIGDTFLAGHKATPFKGDLEVTTQGGVRRALGGAGVHPAHLMLYPGEMIRFGDRVDPDTGGWGRMGRIVNVSYKHGDRSASVAVDNTSRNFDSLLERLAAVGAQVR